MSDGLGVSSLPCAAHPLVSQLSIAFTAPTFQRVLVLLVGAVLAPGRRTVAACLRAARVLVGGDPSSYHRVFSRSSWSLWPLGRVLAGAVRALVPPGEAVVVDADDTVAQHRGKKVYGKGRHRDAVRSSHPSTPLRVEDSHTVWKWGHKWALLAVNVTFPFCSRPWALPVAVALYRAKDLDAKEGRRHKTAAQRARGLMVVDPERSRRAVLVRWFPDLRFVLLGDGGYGSHELARFFHRRRHGRDVALARVLVSRFHPDASLFEQPPQPPAGKKSKCGRPQVKGEKLPSPRETVEGPPGAAAPPATAPTPQTPAARTPATVGWYGGGRRRVELVSGTEHPSTGRRPATGWWRSAGCSSTTWTAPTATSTSSAPT